MKRYLTIATIIATMLLATGCGKLPESSVVSETIFDDTDAAIDDKEVASSATEVAGSIADENTESSAVEESTEEQPTSDSAIESTTAEDATEVAEPAETEQPTVTSPTETEKTEAKKPAETPSKPAESPKPTEKPAETPKPTEKPAETPKPTEKPAETPSPTPTPEVAQKPAHEHTIAWNWHEYRDITIHCPFCGKAQICQDYRVVNICAECGYIRDVVCDWLSVLAPSAFQDSICEECSRPLMHTYSREHAAQGCQECIEYFAELDAQE